MNFDCRSSMSGSRTSDYRWPAAQRYGGAGGGEAKGWAPPLQGFSHSFIRVRKVLVESPFVSLSITVCTPTTSSAAQSRGLLTRGDLRSPTCQMTQVILATNCNCNCNRVPVVHVPDCHYDRNISRTLHTTAVYPVSRSTR